MTLILTVLLITVRLDSSKCPIKANTRDFFILAILSTIKYLKILQEVKE